MRICTTMGFCSKCSSALGLYLAAQLVLTFWSLMPTLGNSQRQDTPTKPSYLTLQRRLIKHHMHYVVIKALSKYGIYGTPLKWHISFLTGRTQQVHVSNMQLFIIGSGLFWNYSRFRGLARVLHNLTLCWQKFSSTLISLNKFARNSKSQCFEAITQLLLLKQPLKIKIK